MKAYLIVIAIMLMALSCEADGAVYKCTDTDGAISYQDQPCKAEEKQRQIQAQRNVSVDGTDLEIVQVPIPDVGLALVALFDHMEHITRRHGDRAATIAVRSKPGHEPMEMQITFFANREGGSYTHQQVAERLANVSPELRQPPLPPSSERWNFETVIGDANMVSHYAPGGGPVNGGWDTVTTGFVAHPRVVAAVTILNNGKTSDGLRWALKVFNMFQIAAGNELLD
jgi:hypothetical protein